MPGHPDRCNGVVIPIFTDVIVIKTVVLDPLKGSDQCRKHIRCRGNEGGISRHRLGPPLDTTGRSGANWLLVTVLDNKPPRCVRGNPSGDKPRAW